MISKDEVQDHLQKAALALAKCDARCTRSEWAAARVNAQFAIDQLYAVVVASSQHEIFDLTSNEAKEAVAMHKYCQRHKAAPGDPCSDEHGACELRLGLV